MNWAKTVVGMACVMMSSSYAMAAAGPFSTAWSQNQPTGGVGKITGSGTYLNAPSVPQGTAYATNQTTGVGYQVAVTVTPGANASGSWTFNLGNLPPGTYIIYVTLTAISNGQAVNTSTATVQITVR